MMDWVFMMPLAIIALLILAVLLIAMEVGFRGHAWLNRRMPREGAEKAAPDYLLSAMLGLLALLLGFTFALALNRHEIRRDLVIQESNAIGTTWLRAQLLKEPYRTRMSTLLRQYVDVRIEWSRASRDSVELGPTSELQRRLWTEMGEALRGDPSTQLTRGLMDAMNESFDLASARTAGRVVHLPAEVLVMLFLCAILSALMLGYMMAVTERRHRIATTLLLLLVGLVMTMIFDLDRPRSGLIQVTQQPLLDLRAAFPP